MGVKNVFICEDHQIFMDGLTGIIQANPDEFKLIETAKNGRYTASKIPFLDVDILLLDLNIPGLNGFEVIKVIRDKQLPIKIILITMYDDSTMIKKAKEAGANAYLLKDVSDETLLSVMRNQDHEKFFIQEGLNNPDHSMFKESFSSVVKLTMREKEVVQLVVKGNTTQEIADILFLSVNTIETHRRNIYRKLEIKSLTELIAFANKYDLMN
jgi:DNA-binding NarL/FixJ family response regulator